MFSKGSKGNKDSFTIETKILPKIAEIDLYLNNESMSPEKANHFEQERESGPDMTPYLMRTVDSKQALDLLTTPQE